MLFAARACLNRTYIQYSRSGFFTTYSIRQRYPCWLNKTSDSVLADFFYAHWVKSWFGDVPSYNYMWCNCAAVAAWFLYAGRLLLFDPDVCHRKGDIHLPHPDKKHLHAYALPYYNHRLRNWSQKFPHYFANADPDFKDRSFSGTRPNRMACHRRPLYWSAYSWLVYKYIEEDPLFTSNSVDNFDKIYHDCGYKKMPWKFPEEEE